MHPQTVTQWPYVGLALTEGQEAGSTLVAVAVSVYKHKHRGNIYSLVMHVCIMARTQNELREGDRVCVCVYGLGRTLVSEAKSHPTSAIKDHCHFKFILKN